MRNTTVTIVALDIVWIGYTACQEGGLKVVPLKLPPTRLAAGIITVKGRTLSPLAELFVACARDTASSIGAAAPVRE